MTTLKLNGFRLNCLGGRGGLDGATGGGQRDQRTGVDGVGGRAFEAPVGPRFLQAGALGVSADGGVISSARARAARPACPVTTGAVRVRMAVRKD